MSACSHRKQIDKSSDKWVSCELPEGHQGEHYSADRTAVPVTWGDGKQQESRQPQQNEIDLVRLVIAAYQSAYGKFHCEEKRPAMEADGMAIGYASVELAKALAARQASQPSHASGELGQVTLNDVPATELAKLAREERDYVEQREREAFQRGQQAMAEKAAQALKEIAYSNEESARTVWDRCFAAIRYLAGAEPQRHCTYCDDDHDEKDCPNRCRERKSR